MKRDFRYLSVTESSTDCLAICILLVDGVYMKITKEIKDKTEFRREKTTRILERVRHSQSTWSNQNNSKWRLSSGHTFLWFS